jgi:hypothetical protein
MTIECANLELIVRLSTFAHGKSARPLACETRFARSGEGAPRSSMVLHSRWSAIDCDWCNGR